MIIPIPYFVSSVNPFNSLLTKCYTNSNRVFLMWPINMLKLKIIN